MFSLLEPICCCASFFLNALNGSLTVHHQLRRVPVLARQLATANCRTSFVSSFPLQVTEVSQSQPRFPGYPQAYDRDVAGNARLGHPREDMMGSSGDLSGA
ncbi:hypothetical protein BT93_F2125 [Corymbia citriodora subsp. variegata]|nr:hypothetical protein BT93_F2125 [Corymbia citriodora subsp. variegata]